MTKSFQDKLRELPQDRQDKIKQRTKEIEYKYRIIYRYSWTYQNWYIKGRR